MTIKTVAKLLSAAAILVLLGCGKKSKDDGKFVVGTEPTFPPFEMQDTKTGEIIGFDIDLIKAIAKDQGLEVEVKNLGFDGLVPALQTGNIDIAASGMSITEERKKQIAFSEPYINAGLAVAVKTSNEKVTSISELNGLTAGVQIGSTGAGHANELLKSGVLKNVKTFENVALAMAELSAGGVDIVINDAPVSEAYVKQQKGNLKLLPGLLQSDSYGFGIRKNNTELLNKINAGLKNVTENGTVEELKAKYFGN